MNRSTIAIVETTDEAVALEASSISARTVPETESHDWHQYTAEDVLWILPRYDRDSWSWAMRIVGHLAALQPWPMAKAIPLVRFWSSCNDGATVADWLAQVGPSAPA